jgi:hypothetical protein
MKQLIAAPRRKLNRKYRNQRAARLRWRCTHVANSFDRLGISAAALACCFKEANPNDAVRQERFEFGGIPPTRCQRISSSPEKNFDRPALA